MTVLSAAQGAISYLVGRRSTALFSSDDPMDIEMADLVNEAATDIAKSSDWQKLTILHTVNGDGVTQAFPLPADYDRMTLGTEVHSSTWFERRYVPAETLDRWLDLKILAPGIPPGYWIILGGQFNVLPTIGPGDNATFFYQSNAISQPQTGPAKASFDTDSDTFVLSERLLKLALIWRWKALKKMDYQEDMRNYEIALSQEQARDKGARKLRNGWRPFGNFSVAYPWPLGS